MNQITEQTKFIGMLKEEIAVKADERLIGYANKYKVKISYQGRSDFFEFTDSVANSHEGKEPKKEDVLYCLVQDYTSDTKDFEEFCQEFGYDSDSRKAESIWKAVKKNHQKMHYIFRNDIEKLITEYENY